MWRFVPIALLLATVEVGFSATNPVVCVSTPYATSITAAGGSFMPALSRDTLHVAFASYANNLVTNDDHAPYLDVFLRELRLEAQPPPRAAQTNMFLVSVNLTGLGGGNDNSVAPSISSNGLRVAFQSYASNLAPNDTNGLSDIFVRDLSSNTTVLVSASHDGLTNADGASFSPIVSLDGRWVVFESEAENLVPNDGNPGSDIFLRDLENNVTRRISASADSFGAGACELRSVTPDCRHVAFIKKSADPQRLEEIFVWRVEDDVAYWASGDIARSDEPMRCFHPAISEDGRFVAFLAAVGTNSLATLYRADLQSNVVLTIASNVAVHPAPAISPSGGFVAYQSNVTVHVWYARTGYQRSYSGFRAEHFAFAVESPEVFFLAFTSTAEASWYLSGGNAVASNSLAVGVPSIAWSRDSIHGWTNYFTALESASPYLVTGDHNREVDIFVGRALATARHPSRPAVSGSGLASVESLTLNPAGDVVAFTSLDGNLAAADTNGALNVFRWERSSGRTHAPMLYEGYAFTDDGWVGPTNYYLARYPLSAPRLTADGTSMLLQNSGPTQTNLHWYYRSSSPTNGNNVVHDPLGRPLHSFQGVISPDGRYVAFATGNEMTYTGRPDRNSASDVVLRDRNIRAYEPAAYEIISLNAQLKPPATRPNGRCSARTEGGCFSAVARRTSWSARRFSFRPISNCMRAISC